MAGPRRHLGTLALCMAIVASARAESFEAFVEDYARDLVAEDSLALRAAWWPEDLAHSERLGLRFRPAQPKIDGASVLLTARDLNPGGATPLEVESLPALLGLARLRVRLREGSPEDQTIYYGHFDGERWWLRHPLGPLTQDWPSEKSRFLRVRRHPSRSPHPIALRASDRFVEDSAGRLGLSTDQLERLAEVGIDWIVAPEGVVTQLVGTPTEGVANLQVDAVVTQHDYHPHELAHLLMNVALGELPAATLPVYQEGVAVWLGGRFNATAPMQLELGALLLEYDFVELRDLLPYSSFRQLPGDLSYSPSAVVVEMLHDQLGSARFLELYRAHSGSFADVNSWTTPRLLDAIALSLGTNIEELNPALDRYLASRRPPRFRGGIDPLPDSAPRLRQGWISARWQAVGRELQLQLRAEPGHELRGAFLWPSIGESFPESELFAEHFPDRTFAGERFALVFAPGELGLYDYALDVLVAKRADGFAPDARFWDAAVSEMRVRIDRDILPGDLAEAEFVAAPR